MVSLERFVSLSERLAIAVTQLAVSLLVVPTWVQEIVKHILMGQ